MASEPKSVLAPGAGTALGSQFAASPAMLALVVLVGLLHTAAHAWGTRADTCLCIHIHTWTRTRHMHIQHAHTHAHIDTTTQPLQRAPACQAGVADRGAMGGGEASWVLSVVNGPVSRQAGSVSRLAP